MLVLKKHFILALFILLFSIPAFTQPIANIEFTSETLQADALQNFLVKGYETPDYQVDTFLTQDTFREGAQYTLQPGDAQLLVKNEPIKISHSPVVITLEFSVLQGRAEMAVVGFNAADGVLDGQLGFCQTTVGESSSPVQRLHVLYQAPDKSVLPGVQISKESGDTQPAKVVLYSLSVYEYTPETLSDINLQPSGTFEGDQKEYLVNINDDEGSVAFQQDPQNVRLDVAGSGQSANIGSQVSGLAEIASPSLLIASVDISKFSGGTGMSALVITDGTWRAVTFIHNQSLPQYPQAKTLIAGGVHAPPNNPFYVFAQNGGGDAPSQTLIDNLEMEQLSLNSIQGLQAVRPFQVPESLAAALISPKSIYKGSQGSFSVLSMEQKTRKPVSAPYKLFLQSNDGKQEEITVNNSSTIVGSDLTNKFAPGPADVSLKVYGKEVLSTQIEVKEGGVLFLETDKPIYKPGQTIQGRVVLTNNALAPLEGDVELTVLDAKGIKIHKESLQTNTFGVASFELPLATELNFGTWKFQAKAGSTNIEKDIVVDKYVLPAFEVDIDQEKDWFMSNETITGVVESHFFFGKPVQGQVKIEALKYVSTWEKFAETTGRLENGRYAFELPAAGYIAGTPGAEGAGSVQLKISVTDDTGHIEQTDKLLTIVSSGLQIKLIPESPQIKPGFNQELLVVTESPEGTPLSTDISMDITFMAEDGSELGSINDRVQTENGLALYQHEIPEKTHIAFVVASGEMDKRPADTTLVQNAVYSPGSHFIHLRQSDEKIYSTGETAVFDVFSTHQGTVYYDVYANGRTVFSHAVEGNKIVFQISPEMSPKAKLIAYMIQPNNEVSVDVLPFDVELNAPVSLQASFDAEEVKPGEPVNLSIQSEGQSMVGLSIVDESVFALAKGRLNLRNVFAELERIFMEPTIEIHEPDDPYQPEINTDAKGTADLLQEHNLQMVTTKSLSVPKAKETDPWRFWGRLPGRFIPLFPGQLEDTTNYKGEGDTYKEPDRVRSFFPETWVWEPELKTDVEGQAALNLTAPDSITTWKLHAVSTSDRGMGITESELRVFQDFFAEPDLPYAVIRGDRFPLKVRLFNYVDQEQHIRVTLEDTEGLGLQDDPVQEIDLPANGIAAVEFTLQPNKVGIVPISIVAQSANRADAIRKNLRVEPEGAQRRMVFNGILNEASNETTVPIRYPEQTVPDSQMLKINMTASMLGQTLSGLEDLLGMPFGCGEQNMIYLAPDVEVLRYFKATGQIMPKIRAKAETFIQTGYQRQLTYRHNDGSFSAFGESDESGSLWLTAFVLSTFSNARDVQTIDETILSAAAAWILSHQNGDGSFNPVGRVIHQEMIGGVNGSGGLTAFVVNALLDYGQAEQNKMQSSLTFLAGKLQDTKIDTYSLALISYALAKADHPSLPTALDLLLERAIADNNGLHWEPHPVESTAYAAMALMMADRIEAQQALDWLASQRNAFGGFHSTQDTVVGLKALTMAAIMQSRDLNANVDVLVNEETIHTFAMHEENFDVLQSLEIKPADEITLRMSGTGKAYYQVVQGFHVPVQPIITEPTAEETMLLDVQYSAEHIEVDDIVDVNVTVSYNGKMEETGMTLVDVSVPTGFTPVQDSLNKLGQQEVFKRIETAGRKVIFYLDHLTAGQPLEFLFQVKALFPVKADSGTSSAYLYYNTDTRAEAGGKEMIVN